MSGYVDIHAHVLPAIDDGPEDLEGSLDLLRAAAASGTRTIAATPHLRPDFPDVHVRELADRCDEVRAAVQREGIPIQVVSGAEVSIVWAVDASDEELTLASYGQRGTDLLIETPTAKFVGIDRFIAQLREKGYRVTLGHAERSRDFQRDDTPLRKFADQGVLLQVNADSLLGLGADRRTQRFAESLVTKGLAHAIASDGHRGDSWRPVTRLAEAAETASELVGAERTRWMTQLAPEAIVEGTALPPAPTVIEAPKRRRLFGRQGR